MKNKQFNFRCDNEDLEVLFNLSQKMHLSYSKIILLGIYILHYLVMISYNGKKFKSSLSLEENEGLMLLLKNWSKIM